MKIAILSDSHDNVDNLQLAVEQATKLGAETMLFCGDFCSPGSSVILAGFKGSIYVVFGNNDGDRIRIFQKMKGLHSNVTFFNDGEGEFTLADKKFAMNHYPFHGRALARTGDYDVVAFGHSHIPGVETYERCVAINPGSTEANQKSVASSFALYDTATHKAELYKIDGSILNS